MSAIKLMAVLICVRAFDAPALVLRTAVLIPSELVSIACALTVIVLPLTVLNTVKVLAPDAIKFVLLNSAEPTIVVY